MQIVYGVCQEYEWKDKIKMDNIRNMIKELNLQKEMEKYFNEKKRNFDINNDNDLMEFVNQYKCYYHGEAKGIMSLLMEFIINKEDVIESITSFRTDTGLFGIGILPTFPWLHAERYKNITKEEFNKSLTGYIKLIFNVPDEEIQIREIWLKQDVYYPKR